ncbi:MAG: hypothetical protein ABUT20_20700, partial [Bacteroidota bacterium]
SDSIYIKFAWFGDVDKPYNGFLFYKTESLYPDQHGNSFVLICQLTDKQFSDIKSLLIDNFGFDLKKPLSNEPCTNYFIGHFSGEKIISGRNISDQNDLINTSRIIKNYFKGTDLFDKINSRWEALFARLGITAR